MLGGGGSVFHESPGEASDDDQGEGVCGVLATLDREVGFFDEKQNGGDDEVAEVACDGGHFIWRFEVRIRREIRSVRRRLGRERPQRASGRWALHILGKGGRRLFREL